MRERLREREIERERERRERRDTERERKRETDREKILTHPVQDGCLTHKGYLDGLVFDIDAVNRPHILLTDPCTPVTCSVLMIGKTVL